MAFGLEFVVIALWRLTLVLRNRRRDKLLREQGFTEEDRIGKAKLLGEQDYTDFENVYVSLLPLLLYSVFLHESIGRGVFFLSPLDICKLTV